MIWFLSGASSEPNSYGVFPDFSHHGKALNRVALQLLREGKTDSFVEAGGFKREHFEMVRNGVLLVEALDEDDKWIKNFTGWVVRKDEDKLYIAIEDHSIVSDQPIESLRIWRPQVDDKPRTFSFDPTRIARDITNDHALVEFSFDPSDPIVYIPLPYKDHYIPARGAQVLVVGYPGAFAFPPPSDSTLSWNNLTYGKVVAITSAHPNEFIWSSTETINKGISGTPTLIVDENGNLTAVGQVHVKYEPIPPGKFVNMPAGMPPLIQFSSLNIDTLLDQLR